jgi:hypothetical protein
VNTEGLVGEMTVLVPVEVPLRVRVPEETTVKPPDAGGVVELTVNSPALANVAKARSENAARRGKELLRFMGWWRVSIIKRGSQGIRIRWPHLFTPFAGAIQ